MNSQLPTGRIAKLEAEIEAKDAEIKSLNERLAIASRRLRRPDAHKRTRSAAGEAAARTAERESPSRCVVSRAAGADEQVSHHKFFKKGPST